MKASDIAEEDALAMKVSSSILLRQAKEAKTAFEHEMMAKASDERLAVSEALCDLANRLRKQGL
jgi:hypothetical protein